MARKGLRRLELKLPDDHPIWSFPPAPGTGRQGVLRFDAGAGGALETVGGDFEPA